MSGAARRKGVMHFVIHAAVTVLAAAAAMVACHQPVSSPTKSGGKRADASPAYTVVELFTSEGCSSCPPADTVLAGLPEAHDHALILAFHVDYWDYIGWKDPYASAEFTRRQRAYAAKLDSGTYTPQMIVNGHEQFIGSDKSAAAKAVRQAAPLGTLAVTAQARKDGEPIRLSVTAPQGTPADAKVYAALTEDHLSSEVKRGENSGRTLKHDGVVRAFVDGTFSKPDAAGAASVCTLTLTPPVGVKESNAHIVIFVQDASTLRVLSAAPVSLRPLEPRPSLPPAAGPSATTPTAPTRR